METFSVLLSLCVGNPPVTRGLLSRRPLTWSFDVFFYVRLNKNDWANNRDAGDLRRRHPHYDVAVMDVLLYTRSLPVAEWTSDSGLLEIDYD